MANAASSTTTTAADRLAKHHEHARHAAAAVPEVKDVLALNISQAKERDATDADPVKEAEKATHRGFMREALDMARLALKTNETPVGCVLVYKGRVIARGMNATNVTRNGSRHAELMALTALLSYSPASDTEGPKGGDPDNEQDWGDVDPTDGHIYPYGQKLHPSPRVTSEIVNQCTLYVTVEPCVMCASLLRQLKIKKVYFGAVNDKFGGTGGVFRIHKNSTVIVEPPHKPVSPATPSEATGAMPGGFFNRLKSFIPKPKPTYPSPATEEENGDESGKEADGPKPPTTIAIAEGTVPAIEDGDGGNVEDGYDVEGGWGRDDAVNLLRQFYVQENGRAPVPRKKEGRAARLAAMMEKEGMSTEGMVIPPPANKPESLVDDEQSQAMGDEVEYGATDQEDSGSQAGSMADSQTTPQPDSSDGGSRTGSFGEKDGQRPSNAQLPSQQQGLGQSKIPGPQQGTAPMARTPVIPIMPLRPPNGKVPALSETKKAEGPKT